MSNQNTPNPHADRLKKAVVAIKKLQGRVKELEAGGAVNSEPVAIVGMGCRFPGNVNSIQDYWTFLKQSPDAITEIPEDRWSMEGWYDPAGGPGKSVANKGGFVDKVDQFDAKFFGITRREANFLDPQQRVFLEVVWEALENAGIRPDGLKGTQTGIFTGVSTSDYLALNLDQLDKTQIDAYSLPGTALNAIPGRVAYFLGVHGPTMAIDTACSASLVAVYQAVESLRKGDANMAIAGGVNVVLNSTTYIGASRFGMLSKTGHCHTFGKDADGMIRSEGCGAVILKRLSDAKKDGDTIYAVIKSGMVNQDGPSSGMTVPNGPAQEKLLTASLKKAQIAGATIDYVEAHGTGTPLGDPIELEALATIYGKDRPADHPLVASSVKANIGHAEAASGIAGLIKTVLCLHHGQITPHRISDLTDAVDWNEMPITVPQKLQDWPATDHPKRAGVSSFGFSGTNAHLILEEAPKVENVTVPQERDHLLSLSAKSEESLKKSAENLSSFIQENPDKLAKISATLIDGRATFDHQLLVHGKDVSELKSHLETYSAGGKLAEGQILAEVVAERSRSASNFKASKTAFMFTGQGAQSPGMGKDIYAGSSVFKKAVDECDELIKSHLGGVSIRELMFEDQEGKIHQTEWTQPALFVFEYAMAKLWESFGIKPNAVIGHSVGEYVAAVLAGVFSLSDGLKLIAARGRLMGSLAGEGAMLFVSAPEDEVRKAISGFENEVSIATINGPESVVISGYKSGIDKVKPIFEETELWIKPLVVSHGFHSPQMDAMLDKFESIATGVTFNAPTLRLISNVTGKMATSEVQTAKYWRNHVREAVRFADGFSTLINAGFNHFVEVGPHPVLCGMTKLITKKGLYIGSTDRKKGQWASLLENVGKTLSAGVKLSGTAIAGLNRPAKMMLPTYSFDHSRYWIPKGKKKAVANPNGHPIIGEKVSIPSGQSFYQKTLFATDEVLDDHRVFGRAVLPGAAYIEAALASQIDENPTFPIVLNDISFLEALQVEDETQVVVNLTNQRGNWEFQSQDSDENWHLHATGSIKNEAVAPPADINRNDTTEDCAGSMNAEAHYDMIEKGGLKFGDSFRLVTETWIGEGKSVAVVNSPIEETKSSKQVLSAGFIDGCLQAIAPLADAESDDGDTFMPIEIGKVTIYDLPKEAVYAIANLSKTTDESMRAGNISVIDEDGKVLIQMDDIRFRKVSEDALRGRQDVTEWLYESVWEAKPLPRFVNVDLAPLNQKLSDQYDKARQKTKLHLYEDLHPKLNKLSAEYALAAINYAFTKLEDVLDSDLYQFSGTVSDWIEKLNVVPEHHKLTGRLFQFMHEFGLVNHENGNYSIDVSTEIANVFALKLKWQKLFAEWPDFRTELSFLNLTAAKIGQVLVGEEDPVGLLFPKGSTEMAGRLNRETPLAKVHNQLIADTMLDVVNAIPKNKKIRILEVGAGTGGTSSFILPHLPAERIEKYAFTDIGALFISQAQETFGQYPFMDFFVLDVENDPSNIEGNYDIILAANVIHATKNLHETLKNVQTLMSPGATLIFAEATRKAPWVDLTYGLTDGWWRFEDDIRDDYPLLSPQKWIDTLSGAGLTSAQSIPHVESEKASDQSVLMAQKPLVKAAKWLIIADEQTFIQSISNHLDQLPIHLVLLDDVSILVDKNQLKSFLGDHDLDKVIYYSTSQDQSLEQPGGNVTGLINLVQTLLESDQGLPQLNVVTVGSQAENGFADAEINLGGSLLWGMMKAVALEHPELHLSAIDLDPKDKFAGGTLVKELIRPANENQTENSVIWRNGLRSVARLTAYNSIADENSGANEVLITENAGVLDSLVWKAEDRRICGENDVEVEVVAYGLNFKDVLNAMGMYPGGPEELGGECAGIVVNIGSSVTDFKAGDRVIASTPGSFRKFVVSPQEFVVPMPAGISFKDAATIPIAYSTALYTLHDMGNIQKGDKILIHAAAGGVGMAAVHLAKFAGAEIFGTAGSDRKRNYLKSIGVDHVMDSRSLDFADEIKEITNGKGVDLVLNALTGDFITKSLEVLSENGRFLEIGKREILTNEQIAALPRNIKYLTFDGGKIGRENPEKMWPVLHRVMVDIVAGNLSALPYDEFAVEECVDAYRFMSAAKHLGKIIVTRPMRGLANQPHQNLPVADEGTYIIAGGLTGLGLLVAEWLTEKGAKRLALFGRSAPSEEATAVLEKLKSAGVQVKTYQGDISSANDVDRIINDARLSLGAIKGVINSAGVLADAPILQQDVAKYKHVFGPKVAGAHHLDQATEKDDLDFFVLFSSGVSLIGSRGQSNHCAANMYMDMLAFRRWAKGKPALSINWGPWGEIGSIVNYGVSERLGKGGVTTIDPQDGLKVLDLLMTENPVQVGVLPINWEKWLSTMPAGLAFFDKQRQIKSKTVKIATKSKETTEIVAQETSNWKHHLARIDQADLIDELLRFVTETAGEVVGLGIGESISPNAPLNEQGIDSLMAVELRNKLSSSLELARPLPATLVFDYPTIQAIAEFIQGKHFADQVESDSKPVTSKIDPVQVPPAGEFDMSNLDALENMTDEEVAAMLAKQMK